MGKMGKMGDLIFDDVQEFIGAVVDHGSVIALRALEQHLLDFFARVKRQVRIVREHSRADVSVVLGVVDLFVQSHAPAQHVCQQRLLEMCFKQRMIQAAKHGYPRRELHDKRHHSIRVGLSG